MRSLGLVKLTALVIGNMVGSGIFLLSSSLAQYGSISIIAWIFTSIGSILIAIVFARLSALLPKAGGPYAYCHEAFGGFVGFLIAYMYWIYSWVGNAAIATSLISYFTYFMPFISQSSLFSFLLIAGVVWLLTWVNILGVATAGTLQVITVFLKIIPLIFISFLGFFFIKFQNLSAFNVTTHSNFFALTSSAALTMWALTGVESATVPADHVDNPKKNIPLATILGTVIAITLYILSTIVVMGIIPMSSLAKSNAPFAEAAKLAIGPIGGGIIAMAAIISSFGALNGWILLQGQVPHAASVNKVFPGYFKKLSRFNTPSNALIVSSLLITALLLMNYHQNLVDKFTNIISLATVSILLVYGVTMIAEIKLLIKNRNFQSFYRKISINILALFYIIWACYGLDHQMLFYCLLLSLSGVPIYFWNRFRQNEWQYSRSIE